MNYNRKIQYEARWTSVETPSLFESNGEVTILAHYIDYWAGRLDGLYEVLVVPLHYIYSARGELIPTYRVNSHIEKAIGRTEISRVYKECLEVAKKVLPLCLGLGK